VAGGPALKAMLNSRDRLPYRLPIEVSSRVPTALYGLLVVGCPLELYQIYPIPGKGGGQYFKPR